MNTIQLKNLQHKLILILLFLFVFSCRKKGCTNPKAINYDISAKKEDGSCEFTASLHFWVSYASADSLDLTFPIQLYVRQIEVGTLSDDQMRVVAPSSCVEEKNTVLSSVYFNTERADVVFKVVNHTGEVVVEKKIANITPEECRKIRI